LQNSQKMLAWTRFTYLLALTYNPKYVQPTMYMSDGYILPLAQLIKKEVSIPIIGVGKIHDPSLAAEAVIKGKVDAIAILQTAYC